MKNKFIKLCYCYYFHADTVYVGTYIHGVTQPMYDYSVYSMYKPQFLFVYLLFSYIEK